MSKKDTLSKKKKKNQKESKKAPYQGTLKQV